MATKECEHHDRRLQSIEQTLYGRDGEPGVIKRCRAELDEHREELALHTKYFNWVVGGWFVLSVALAIHKFLTGAP